MIPALVFFTGNKAAIVVKYISQTVKRVLLCNDSIEKAFHVEFERNPDAKRERRMNMNSQRKYKFSWDLLGNVAQGRPNLGPLTRLEVYRLMQFTFRDVVEQNFGAEMADEIFYEAGKVAGEEFYHHIIGQSTTFEDFFSRLQKNMKDMGIGILRMEKADMAAQEYVFTVSEDLDCSGLPEMDQGICVYDEGFIAGVLECFSGRKFRVKEVDCWCTGDRTCRFVATMEG